MSESSNPSAPARAVTLRAVVLGLAGVFFICAVTPFNNYVLNNTPLVGNLLPVGLLLFLSVIVLLINGVLRRTAPRRALQVGELAVIFAMTLVTCAIPGGGLMRWLPAHLVGLYYEAVTNPQAAAALDAAPLAGWLYPEFEHTAAAQRGVEPLVRDYLGRNIDGEVPWSKWVRPAIAWGILLALLYSAMAALMLIVRRQWQENERLAFPLAEVFATLLEPPQEGRAWPPLFRSRLFWISALSVFALHALTGLAQYFPRVPSISFAYNFNALFADPPLYAATYGLKAAKLVFTIVGISYFINLRVSFSIVFFFLLFNVIQITLGMNGQTLSEGMQRDQTLGAIAVMAAVMAYVGRSHWLLVLRCMIGKRRADEEGGDALVSYRTAGWVLMLAAAGAVMWVHLAGASIIVSVCVVVGVLSFWLVMARLAAESGLIYAQLHNAPLGRAITIATMDLPLPRPDGQSVHAGSLLSSILVTDQRESPAVYTSSALVTVSRTWRGRSMRLLPVLILLALLLGFGTAGASTLWCEYRFGNTLDLSQASPINTNGVTMHPRWYVLGPLMDYLSPAGGPREMHSRLVHVGIGALATTLISVLYLRFGGFPLHPIGVLMAYSYPVQNSWLGIFAGWLLKSAITHFGGASLYRAARPFFLGLIFGEAGAVAAWLGVNMVLAWMGVPYRAIQLMLP